RELASIPILFRGCVSTRVCEFQIEPVVREVLALEKRAAMAMETISSILFVARIIFSMKKLESALFLLGERRCALKHSIEFRIVGCLREKKLLQRASNPIRSDLRSSKRIFKKRRIRGFQLRAGSIIEAWNLGLLWSLKLGAWCFHFQTPLPPAT